ncbi:hypothetical protein CEP52_004012 [Fusarium oligoseptatum]|uniref:RRM domain-containing protein n=1 Tax=Fusarium oligoseptatum TaxID=2604345 RepID=A0A428U678_9HYPO|nr:hypothetical protein CEP52_004012 [Fusarium oligoseptatum]
MAPELRKRKSVSDVQKANGVAKPVKAAKGKRKAAEDGSPVSLKKQSRRKKSKKSKTVEEVKVVEEEETTTLDIPDESESEAEESNEVKAIVEELDSGDEDITEGDAVFKPGQDVGKIPKVSKAVQKAAEGADEDAGVIYIGRIPHGFYEHEMRQYFEQFGTIVALRLSRNKKTGASKHYAFVKFAEATTAEIVAKTMDNYLLFGHILKCRVIPKEQVHDDLFKGANRRFKAVPWNKMAGYQLQKPLTEAGWTKKVSKEQSRRAKKAAKLKEIGYEFEAPAIKDVPPPAPKAIENGEEVKAIEAAPAEKEEEPKVEEPKVEEPAEVAEPEPEPVVEEPEVKKTKAKPAAKAKKVKGTKSKGPQGKGLSESFNDLGVQRH